MKSQRRDGDGEPPPAAAAGVPGQPGRPATGISPAERLDDQLRAVVEQTRPRLRFLFWVHRIRPEDAEDVIQEALIALLRRWPDAKDATQLPEVKDPATFLIGTVRLRIFNFLRRRSAERCVQVDASRLEEIAGGHSPQLAVDCRQDANELLSLLPPRAGRIVAMWYGEELSSREIAAALELSESGVRTLAGRHLRRLQRYVKSERLR
jgi:RNA polymerase sigma factor (sigma-70 family)